MTNDSPSEGSVRKQIERLEKEIARRGGMIGGMRGLDPETYLAFLKQVMDTEMVINNPDEWGIDLAEEIRQRIDPPADPDGLDDAEVARLLREMIDLLARFHLSLGESDHLDDRELYRMILDDIAKTPLEVGPGERGTLVHHSCCPCDSEDWYRFYAEDGERAEWAKAMGRPVPEKKALQADRDDWIRSLAENYRNDPLPELSLPRK